MSGISELLPFVLDSSVNHLQNYLAACQEHVAFHGKDKKSEDYLKLINVRLNENENRFEGLLILNVALEQCSVEAFVDNAKSWMTCSLKGTHEKNQNVANISFSVLEKLLKMAVKFPEIKKHASANILPNILLHSKKDINYETVQSFLKCLIVCMQEYPGSCGEYNRILLDFLRRLLDSEPYLLTLAAKCFALLTQIKGKGREGVSFQSLWSTDQLVLVHTLHHYLDLLFSNVDEIETGHHPPAGNIELLIAKGANNGGLVTERMQFVMKHIGGLSKYLQSMLLGSFPVAKPVMPDIILGLICRGLAVTCNSLGHSTIDSVALKVVLPNIHTDLVNILIALITCCSRNLLQYGSLICKLVSQELKWTNVQDWPYGLDKPYRQLRSAVYNCLHCWLSVSRSASSIETVLEDIVQFVLQDTHVEKPIIALKARSSSTKKNQPQFNYVSGSRNDKLDKQLANNVLCLHALKCLQLIIYSSTGFMKSSVCKAIQESVVTLLFEVQNTHAGPPIPYRDNSCRKELYSTLLALCSEPHATCPPPINYALALFKAGLHDSLSEVSVICLNGLSNIEKILHPSAPPLSSALQYIPSEQEQHQQQQIEEIENNEIVLRSSTNTKKSINDIPLSAFPNLKNVIVIKVIHDDHNKNENIRESIYDHDDNSMDTSNLSNENSVKSIQKTVINVEDSRTNNENCTLGDVISLGNDKVDKEVILSDNDSSVKENDEINNDNKSEDCDSNDNISDEELEKHSKVVTSVFEKINGICSNNNDKENKIKCEPIEEVTQYKESQGLITMTDSFNDLCNEPPIKKMKTVSKVILNASPKKLNLENSDDLVTVSKENNMNGDSNSVHEEDDMMNCFVDMV